MANGLINLQTDLKSLRYGSETPYVTKDINNPPSSNQIGMQASKRIDDTSRIVQMLASKPGLTYLANEALLKQAEVQSKADKAKRAKKSIAGAILQQLGDTFVSTVKIVGSTLAQVPVNGTGTHFLKGFKTDTYLQPTNQGKTNAFTRFFGAGGVEGAPYALDGQIVPGAVEVNNQNFVQTSITGRELELIPSQYSYGARVLEDRNETKNTPIAEWASKEDSNSSYAAKGKVISIITSELKPVTGRNPDTGESVVMEGFNIPANNNVGVETTATKGVLTKQNLIKSISHTGSIDGDVNPDSSTNVASASYSYSSTYTGKEAKTSINNAQTGAPIPTQYGRDTTVAKNTFGTTISNNLSGSQIATLPPGSEFKDTNTFTYDKGYADGEKKLINKTGYNYPDIQTAISQSGDGDRLSDGKQKYTAEETYTGKTTEENIQTVISSTDSAGYINNHRIFVGKDVGNFEVNKLLKEDSFATTAQYADQKQIADVTTLSLPIDIDEIYRPSSSIDVSPGPSTTISDFRKDFGNMYSYDYNAKTVNREQRVTLGNQGRKRASYKDYMGTLEDSVLMRDALNAQDISSKSLDGVDAGRDFAKFYFEIITPDGSKFLHFRAFIDSIDDSYSADWQARKYNGRAENFYTYGGFDRDISVSFNIAAASREEMNPLYKKMVYLASATAPTYGDSGLMRGTLAKLTIGSYFSQIPGVLTSVKYSVDNNIPWEIAMANPEAGADDDVQELPMMLKCTISFKPIHDFAPQTGLQHYFTNPNPIGGAKAFF